MCGLRARYKLKNVRWFSWTTRHARTALISVFRTDQSNSWHARTALISVFRTDQSNSWHARTVLISVFRTDQSNSWHARTALISVFSTDQSNSWLNGLFDHSASSFCFKEIKVWDDGITSHSCDQYKSHDPAGRRGRDGQKRGMIGFYILTGIFGASYRLQEKVKCI
jgi:hypothetical protein